MANKSATKNVPIAKKTPAKPSTLTPDKCCESICELLERLIGAAERIALALEKQVESSNRVAGRAAQLKALGGGPATLAAAAARRADIPLAATEAAGAAAAACSMTSEEVFTILVAVYKKESGDTRDIKRGTKLRTGGVGLDNLAVEALASNTIEAINDSNSACTVTGIHDSEIAALSKTFGDMADVIFGNLG